MHKAVEKAFTEFVFDYHENVFQSYVHFFDVTLPQIMKTNYKKDFNTKKKYKQKIKKSQNNML